MITRINCIAPEADIQALRGKKMNVTQKNTPPHWITYSDNGRVKIKLTPTDEEWKNKLALTKFKTIAPKITNLKAIMLSDPLLSGLIRLNEFAQRLEFAKRPPWDNSGTITLSDDDVMKLRVYLAETYDVEFSKDNLYTVITAIASEEKYHPIKQMIESSPWDGTPRAERIFIDYMGAEDNAYTKAVAKTWLTGAVRRIYQPGCKFELVPVLQGKQGRGKSTLAGKLGGDWFTDQLSDMRGKDSKDFMKGVWILELSELSAMRRTEIEEVKSFISATVDRFRPAYGRLTQDYPRTAVFIATTNDNGYLKDLTGSRRFAPILIDEAERTKDVFNIDPVTIQQIWAEAYQWNKKHHSVHLSREIETIADDYREQAQDENPMRAMIMEYLNVKLPINWEEFSSMRRRDYISSVMNNIKSNNGQIIRDRITTREVLIELFNREPYDELRGDTEARKIALILNNLDGWKATKYKIRGIQSKGYKRVDE